MLTLLNLLKAPSAAMTTLLDRGFAGLLFSRYYTPVFLISNAVDTLSFALGPSLSTLSFGLPVAV
jgi:hypothetical protein